MTKASFGLKAVVAVAVVAFLAGGALSAVVIGDVLQTPCTEVTADLQDERDTLSETFGSGEEGDAALSTMRNAAQRRPDCFSQAERDLFNAVPSGGGTDFATEMPSG